MLAFAAMILNFVIMKAMLFLMWFVLVVPVLMWVLITLNWLPITFIFVRSLYKKYTAGVLALPIFLAMWSVPALSIQWTKKSEIRQEFEFHQTFDFVEPVDILRAYTKFIKHDEKITDLEIKALMQGDIDRIVTIRSSRHFNYRKITIEAETMTIDGQFKNAVAYQPVPMAKCLTENLSEVQSGFLRENPELPFCVVQENIENQGFASWEKVILLRGTNRHNDTEGLFMGNVQSISEEQRKQANGRVVGEYIRIKADIEQSQQRLKRRVEYPRLLPVFTPASFGDFNVHDDFFFIPGHTEEMISEAVDLEQRWDLIFKRNTIRASRAR